MQLYEAIYAALDGSAILFAGSGFSYGAINNKNNSVVAGEKLRDALANDCGIANTNESLETVSQYYVNKRSKADLISFLKGEFRIKKIAPHHEAIMSLPWKRIYTTNFDHVVEMAAQKNARLLDSVVPTDEIDNFDITNVCVHLNGSIERLGLSNIDTDFKLTDKSYAVDSLKSSDWYQLFSDDLSTTRAVIIVGYSMKYDIDIKRLLALPEIHKKVIFIDKHDPDEISRSLLEQYGDCEFIGIEAFAKQIISEKSVFTPSVLSTSFECFEHEYKTTFTPQTVTFNDLIDLYVKGDYSVKLSEKKSQTDPNADYRYIISREKTELLLKQQNNVRAFLVLSDLGNGKTMFCNLLRDIFRTENVDVYTFTRNTEMLPNEIEYIVTNSVKRRAFVIIDDFRSKLDILRGFRNYNTENIRFILTSRKAVAPRISVLYGVLGIAESDVFPLYIDRLSNTEIQHLAEVILDNSLLSSKIKSSQHDDIVEYLTTKCNSKFSDILLELFDSSGIKTRILSVWSNIQSASSNVRTLAILALMKSVMSIYMDYSEIMELLRIDYIKFSDDDRELLEEIFSYEQNDVIIKSSVIASKLLYEFVDLKDLVNVITLVLTEMETRSDRYQAHFELSKNLVSHSHFRNFVDKGNNNDIIKNFYDGIRNNRFYRGNAFFWEQYASACIDTGAFDVATQCIENAFTIANEIPNFVPYHIETVKARFIMEKLIADINAQRVPKADAALTAVIDCHACLVKYFDHPDNDISMVYRVSEKYKIVFDQYREEFDRRQRSMFAERCADMLKRMRISLAKNECDPHLLSKLISQLENCKW
jgi:hypothetical protein